MRLMQESHIEDYLFIGGDQMPAQDAAQRLGLSERTVYRYRAILRRRAQELAE
jgi:DNA-binding CsgD family transcriptional regulator